MTIANTYKAMTAQQDLKLQLWKSEKTTKIGKTKWKRDNTDTQRTITKFCDVSTLNKKQA